MNSPETYRETESKLIPKNLAACHELMIFRHLAEPIKQIYMSHPQDPCSLRVRRQGVEPRYTATLKIPIKNPIEHDSLEVETDISADTYKFYEGQDQLPRLQKQRATVLPGITIDWIDGLPNPLLEIEKPASIDNTPWLDPNLYQDVSTDNRYHNANIAYRISNPIHNKSLQPYTPTDTAQQVEHLLSEIDRRQANKEDSVVATVAGGSASGKTSRVARVLAQETGGTLISMDDYYMGQAIAKELYGYNLTDINFDHPEYYRTRLLGTHLAKLALGQTVALRKYQMATAELADEYSKITAVPGKPIIVEGIYASHPEIAKAADITAFVDAPMHIRTMRRIMRDHFIGEREVVFSTPKEHLRYLLEVCEPSFEAHGAHQKQSANVIINT